MYYYYYFGLECPCVCLSSGDSSITQRKRRERIASETLMSMSVRGGQTMFNLCANLGISTRAAASPDDSFGYCENVPFSLHFRLRLVVGNGFWVDLSERFRAPEVQPWSQGSPGWRSATICVVVWPACELFLICRKLYTEKNN